MGLSEHGVAIPHSVQNKLGDGRLEKGRWGTDKENDIYIIAWDFAEDCKGEECPLYKKCEYIKSWRHRPDRIGKKCGAAGKCEMQQRYLKNVLKAVVDKMQQSKSTRDTMIKLGYHLIPLYAQLFKFKMWEYANKDIIIYSQGSPKVHPVYKEMREIIKTLTSVWKDMNSVFKEKADPGRVGDGAFIDAMYNVAGEKVDSKGTGIDFDSESDSESNERDSSNTDGEADDFDSYLGGDEKPKKKQKPMTKAQRRKHNERRRVDRRKSPMGGNRKKRRAKADVVPYHGNARARQEAKKNQDLEKESEKEPEKKTRRRRK